MYSFVPEQYFRRELNYFFDFFPSQMDFIDFMRDEVLRDDISKGISNSFLTVLYYSFERLYRNKIVYEQEYFCQDFTREMFEKLRKLQILYQLWKTKNEDDPFEMINENYNEWYNHNRTDDSSEKQKMTLEDTVKVKGKEEGDVEVDTSAQVKGQTTASTQDVTNNSEQSRDNDGSLQAPLALSDLEMVDEVISDGKDTATSASTSRSKSVGQTDSVNESNNLSDTTSQSKNKRQNESERLNLSTNERENNYHNDTHTKDERKSTRLNKTNVLNSFTDLDLQAGFNRFARSFQHLFSRMNSKDFYWNGYYETDMENVELPPIPKHETPLSNLIKVINIGYIPSEDVNGEKITEQVIFTNPQATTRDFYVANIEVERGIAYLNGDGDYNGIVMVDFHISPQFKKDNFRKE